MSAERDPTRRDIPINPPVRNSRELWASMNFRCSVQAGFGDSVVPEDTIVENNDGKHPSEIKRMKQANVVPTK